MTRQPHRLGRRRARRLLDGDPAARTGAAGLAVLIDALTPAAADERETPAQLLAAFTRQAEAVPRAGRRPRSAAHGGARRRYVRRALTVKTAAVVLVLSGGTMAAAAADALPGPAQRAAYELFGSWGVPAPSLPPREGGPQNPEPGTGPVVVPEGTAPAGTASSPAAGEDPGASATPSASASDCDGHTHGNGRRCATNGKGDADDNVVDDSASPAASATATSTQTPTPTPSVRSTHTPPGRYRKHDADMDAGTLDVESTPDPATPSPVVSGTPSAASTPTASGTPTAVTSPSAAGTPTASASPGMPEG
jgi:hypothetical protein